MKKMLSTIRHRGPDEFGLYKDSHVVLGHARLSIIDLSGGHQPMANEDKTVWITFNGEIFNYLELRQDLLNKGHKLATSSDTEVIIHLFEDHGPDCLKYLNGQFSFAIWDKNKKELFVARDRIGIRPLFYAMEENIFYFSSEIKALFASGGLRREIDPVALDQIFTMWSTIPPQTAFKGINELAPGSYLIIKNGQIYREQYWDLDFPNKPEKLSFDDASERLKDLLIDATRLQLRADVPVGAYLSGGLDSSVITALVRNFSNAPLQTFSISFEDRDYDESSYQKEMAKVLGTEHNELICTNKDINQNFSDAMWHIEKPILRTAPVPMFILSKLVRDSHFKVVLTGEGADEALGGYDIFKETKIRQFWARYPESQCRPLLLKKLYPYLPAFQGQPKAYKEAFFQDGISDPSSLFFSHKPRWITTSKAKIFFSEDVKNRIANQNTEQTFEKSLPEAFQDWSPLAKAQYIETKNLLPGYILSSQGDRVSMAHSIEGRFPFLDHRVIEYCAALPQHYKISGLNEKHILKESMRPFLPANIIKRTKQPYLAPDGKSFFHNGKAVDYVEELLSERYLKRYGYFNPSSVKLLLNKFKKSGVIGFKDNMALMGILSTQLLHKRFIDDFYGSHGLEEVNVVVKGE